MIVLAISGLLFISAVILIGGKQNQTAFDQAIREIQSQIQQAINDVGSGFYPNLGNTQCSGAGSVVTITNSAGTGQGANAGCVFLGKALQFQVAGTDPEQFNIFSVAGLQNGASGGGDSTSLTEANPKAIAPSTAEPALPNSTEVHALENGLTTYKMWYNNGGADKPIGMVAFTQSLAPVTAGTSSSQQVNVVPIDDGNNLSALGKSSVNGADAIDLSLKNSPVNPTNGVFICFVSGGTNQSGLITIGNNGRQLSVKLDIKSGTVC